MYKIILTSSVPNRYVNKLLLIMRLTIVIILATLMQVSASGYGQRITLKTKGDPLDKVIKEIRNQSGYDFLYDLELIKKTKPVTINITNATIEEVLEKLFINQPFTYKIKNKAVLLKQKEKSILDKLADFLQTKNQEIIKGKVLDETGRPMPSAVIRIKGTNTTLITDEDGEFTFKNLESNAILQINYVGYITKEISVKDIKGYIVITMERSDNKLEEVNIVSTGYQKLPKERVTGSFEIINKDLFNRSPGTDVLSRLNGVTTGIQFSGFNVPSTINPQNNSVAGRKITLLNQMSIRGISTLQLITAAPLIVLDNFPYEGDINNINPNDVENVTILKDAAAASIWGIRASNGVVVITTKKGKYEQPLRLTLNSNLTIGAKPNLFYQNLISSSDYIDIEKLAFSNGQYTDVISDPYFTALSPVVDLLAKQAALPANDIQGKAAIDKQIDALRNYDIRNDMLKYVYRNSINQQYSLNVSGGSKQISYLLSGGYDRNRDSEIDINYRRLNLRSSITYKPLKNLDVSTDILYTDNKYHTAYIDNDGGNGRLLSKLSAQPYIRLADEQGNHLEIVNPYENILDLKNEYRKTAGNGRLLDWTYIPLNDLGTGYSESKSQNILMNIGANYRIIPGLNASINYQYGKNTEEAVSQADVDSYAVRSKINLYASYSETNLNSPAKFNVPVGGKYSKVDAFQLSNSLRGQLNFNKTWDKVHDLNAIAGAERREFKQYGTPGITLWGYQADPLTFKPYPYNQSIPLLNGLDNELQGGPGIEGIQNLINRNTSIFTNIAYTYKGKYTVSGSARKDASNVFGVNVNRRGQPTWSLGAGWNISNESFFQPGLLQSLKLRATYGYLGNVNNNLSAYPIIIYGSVPNSITQLTSAISKNPPNPNLGPERTGIFNLGVDFSLKNNRISGSVELYRKKSINLIAPTPIDLSTGFTNLSVNSANLKATGIDINLSSINIQSLNFQWNSNLLFSYTHNVVTKYLLTGSNLATDYVSLPGGSIPQNIYKEGNDPFSLYTYKWAGLDPNNGDPMGYVNGQPSKDYDKLVNTKYSDLENNGSVIPLYYGAFRNTFNWKSFSLSANILYKFDYKLNPPGINYSSLFSGGSTVDYNKRWQRPGDEKTTNVPSLVYPTDSYRDQFYQGSSARVISGDHIRLQDIRLSYSINKPTPYLQNIQLYTNVNNVGIIWRANKSGIDPDSFINPPLPRSLTFGITAGF